MIENYRRASQKMLHTVERYKQNAGCLIIHLLQEYDSEDFLPG